MNPTTPVTPQPNLNAGSPLLAAAAQNQDQQPDAVDTAQQPTAPVNGGATIGQRTGFNADAFKAKLAADSQRSIAAGMSPLPALVAAAIGANNPQNTTTAKDDTSGPQMTGPNPQTTTQKVAGAGLSALKGFGNALGDAGAVGTVPRGGGALTGITRTLGARQQRERQEVIDKSELNKNAVLTAEANTRMIHEQRLIHNLDEDAKDTAVKNGSMQLETLLHQPAPSTVIAKDLTADQIGPYMQAQGQQQAKFDPAKETAIATGFKNVGTDPKTGLPIRQITYSLVSLPDDVKLDPNDPKQKANLDLLNEYAPPTNGGKWGDGGHQNMTGTQYNLLTQQAHDKVATELALEKAGVEAGYQKDELNKAREASAFKNDPQIVRALAQASGNGNVMAARTQLLQMNADPNSPMAGKYNNLDNDLRQYYGTDPKGNSIYDKMLEDYQKKLDASQEQITNISNKLSTAGNLEEINNIGADAAARLADPNTPKEQRAQLQRIVDRAQADISKGKTFMADQEREKARIKKEIDEQEPTASEADKALVKQIGEGRSAFPNPRTKEGARLAKLVAIAYPDASEAKFPAWKDAVTRFTSGKTGDALNSSNTVLEHLQRAFETSGSWGATAVGGFHIPGTNVQIGTEAYNRLQTDKPFLVGELGKAVKGGVIGVEESKEIEKALFGGFTPGDKQNKLKEAAQLLMDKIDQYQQQFNDAAPSKNIVVPTLLKPSAKASYDYIMSGGTVGKSVQQVAKEQQQEYAQRAATGAPASAINPGKPGKVKNPDGSITFVWQTRDGSVRDAQNNRYVNGVKVQ